MAYGNLVRLGGIFGLLSVVAMIPAYLVGSPDLPGSPEEAGSYFEEGLGTFVFSNGVLPLLHVFFFILFLGCCTDCSEAPKKTVIGEEQEE